MTMFLGFFWLAVGIINGFAGDIWTAAFAAAGSIVWIAVAGIEKHFPETQN